MCQFVRGWPDLDEDRSAVTSSKARLGVVNGIAGVSFLLFECLVCGRAISLKLDSEGEVDAEFIIPPNLMCAWTDDTLIWQRTADKPLPISGY